MLPQTAQQLLVFVTVKSEGLLCQCLGLGVFGVALPADLLPGNCLGRQSQFHADRPAPQVTADRTDQ
ncbi:hypothetical protein D3C84_1221950 [compost metagenome]